MHHHLHIRYVAVSRMIFVLLLLNVMYMILASALPAASQGPLFYIFVWLIPLVFSASVTIVVSTLFLPHHHRLGNKIALRISTLNTICSVFLFVFVIAFIW